MDKVIKKIEVLQEENSKLEGVSIIIPSYKGENYILDCLYSIYRQSIDKNLLEIIIIFNGERDSSERIVNKFINENKISNIIIVNVDENGVGEARNIGLELVTKKYVTFIDDDDYISEKFIEQLYKNAQENRIVISQIFNIDEDGEVDKKNLVNNQICKYEGVVDNPIVNINKMLTLNACKLIPTNLLGNMRYKSNLKSGEDVVFYSELVCKTDSEYYVTPKHEEAIYYRRLRKNSVSRKKMSFQFNVIERIQVINELNILYGNTDDEIKRSFIKGNIVSQCNFINGYLSEEPEQEKDVVKQIMLYRKLPLHIEEKKVVYKGEVKKNEEDIVYNNEVYYKLYRQIEYHSKDWYAPIKEIKIEDNIKYDIDGGYYISYKEMNASFSIAPKNTDIGIDKNNVYKFRLNGSYSNKDAVLYVITFKEEERSTAYAIEINKDLIIRFPEDVDKIRLAIKCTGRGILNIENITIERKRVLGLMDIESYRKLGFDKPKSLKELKVAAICDEFTYECLKSEVNLITFTPDEWRAKLEITKPHMLFVESVWLGKNGEWSRKVCSHNGAGLEYLREIIEWCKTRNIPTIFWNKEDPIHFKGFINAAKLFDYIYTTDENMMEEYKRQAPNSKIDVMQFFARPDIHNPIKMFKERKNAACFAGSYYAIKFEERQKDMLDLLNITRALDLVIYDRHFGENNPQYEFPDEFKKHIIGKLPPWEVVRAYKKYKYLVNVNSVVTSPTMFSRRVFEGLACGTPIISTYSEAIEKTFGNIVIMGKNYDETKKKFNKVIENEDLYNKLKVKGIREVYLKHTIEHRFNKICNNVGIELQINKKKIGIITYINNNKDYIRFKEFVEKQNNDDIFGILVSNLELENEERIFIVRNKKEVINIMKKMDYVGIIDLKNYYGKNYVLDMIIATQYCNCNICGKGEYYKNDDLTSINKLNLIIDNSTNLKITNLGSEYKYVKSINKDTIFINTELFNRYDEENILDLIITGDVETLLNFGERVFSIDRYNFIEGGNEGAEEFMSQIEV